VEAKGCVTVNGTSMPLIDRNDLAARSRLGGIRLAPVTSNDMAPPCDSTPSSDEP
jgi:hypothetical protein